MRTEEKLPCIRFYQFRSGGKEWVRIPGGGDAPEIAAPVRTRAVWKEALNRNSEQRGYGDTERQETRVMVAGG